MSTGVHTVKRSSIQRLREGAEAAEAAFELAEESDRLPALLRFEAALQALSDAYFREWPPDQRR
jgi:hypothetical protein